MTFKKGQSGNPSGRPKMPKEIQIAVRHNGKHAVQRMEQLLSDDSAWGPDGWMKPREQILLARTAQERAFGKIVRVDLDHRHGGLPLQNLAISRQLLRPLPSK